MVQMTIRIRDINKRINQNKSPLDILGVMRFLISGLFRMGLQ